MANRLYQSHPLFAFFLSYLLAPSLPLPLPLLYLYINYCTNNSVQTILDQKNVYQKIVQPARFLQFTQHSAYHTRVARTK